MRHQDMTTARDNSGDKQHEEKRVKALQMIYDLRFIFNMEDLARIFLHEYVAENSRPLAGHRKDAVADQVMHRM